MPRFLVATERQKAVDKEVANALVVVRVEAQHVLIVRHGRFTLA